MSISSLISIGLISWTIVGLAEPGYIVKQKSHNCDIVIVNDGHIDLKVYGVLDNGTALKPFKMNANDHVHYIDLYDMNHVCHEGMSLYVLSDKGKALYSAYTEVNSTIHLIPVNS
jgi:hypothetical protein